MRNESDEAAEEDDHAAVLAEEVLPELDARGRHADVPAIADEERVGVSLPDPIPEVVAHDRADRGCSDHKPNVERGICRPHRSRRERGWSHPEEGMPMLSNPTMSAITQ